MTHQATLGTWAGKPQWRCKRCQYTTLSEKGMVAHLRGAHRVRPDQISIPAPRGNDADFAGQPSTDWSRKALDNYAIANGVTGAASLPSKQAVIDAVDAEIKAVNESTQDAADTADSSEE